MATTDATVTNVERLERIHTDLNRRNLLPGEHIVDAGYTSAELLISTQRDFRITLLGPCASTTPTGLLRDADQLTTVPFPAD